MPFVKNSETWFSVCQSTHLFLVTIIKETLLSKLRCLLERVDLVPLGSAQISIFNRVLSQRLTWLLFLHDLSWVERELEPIATSYLKKWSGLAKAADPSRLYLRKSEQGLQGVSLTMMSSKSLAMFHFCHLKMPEFVILLFHTTIFLCLHNQKFNSAQVKSVLKTKCTG